MNTQIQFQGEVVKLGFLVIRGEKVKTKPKKSEVGCDKSFNGQKFE